MIQQIRDWFRPKGVFYLEHWRAGKMIAKIKIPNAVTTTGKNNIFDSFFRNNAPPTNWYMGLIDSAAFTAVAVSDTMAAHPGWTELQAYTEATRQAWTAAAASNGQVTNAASVATFNMNATNSIKGSFIVSNNTKGGATGILWTTGLFATALAVVNGDQVKLTYNLAA